MADLAKDVVERSVTVPGVQAKLSMSLIKETQETSDGRLNVVGALGGGYIFKPPSESYPEMPQNEHLTMRIAEAFDKYKSSMERIGKTLGMYSANPLLDKLFFFELALFCFLSGNNDMHLKNFSMIESESGWILSPAYDLLNVTIINPEDDEELALTLEGKKKKIKREHFDRLGEGLGLSLKQLNGVYNRFNNNKPKAFYWINDSFLSTKLKKAYKELLEDRFARIYSSNTFQA
jgi:serine/threonine-protein kinase HipA